MFLPFHHVTVPLVTALGYKNSSITWICAVYWLQPRSCLETLAHGGSFTSCNSHAGSCQQQGAGLVVHTISASLLQQLLIHPALPQPSIQVPSCLSSEACTASCFLTSLLTI